METDRFNAFSDGVFAILITILVLEFHIPVFKTGHLLAALDTQGPTFVSYLFSYLYVGTLWLFHHDYFSLLTRIDRNVNMLNLLMLFSITLIDYPMSLLGATLTTGNRADLQTAFVMYDIVALFISATFYLMYLYIHRHPELHRHQIPKTFYDSIKLDPVKSILIYGVAILSSFWSISLSAALLILEIVFHFFAYLRMGRSLDRLHPTTHH
ncbi:hypothetical protein AYR62_05115 [Secundilactobacillus paracollinoides]|uniref:TMEM175 family protein n=1 Tax=Secundilactobacillus paracollinoides TaxID=240427 RepID=UPI00081A4FB4|nr:TMEM175 family protein [Secundilactobacillus paracollinoides]ANZ61892.1 hypothetical protein AYR61_11380 [Secundilactobacillus paracollinoides]ANZ63531.1 hypothetical protein AYR62_05115 [Secundilactobacillus paracollinoides]